MSGTVAESVTAATLLFTKTMKKFCKHITAKCSTWCYTVKCCDYFSLFPALLEQKNSCSGLKKYIIQSSKDLFHQQGIHCAIAHKATSSFLNKVVFTQ